MHIVSIPPSGGGFSRQKMVKSGSSKVASSNNFDRQQLPSWQSDPTYPSTITNSNSLVSSGGGAATVSLSGTFTASLGFTDTVLELRRNNTVVATVTQSSPSLANTPYTISMSWTGVVVSGDIFTAWAAVGPIKDVSITSGYVEVVPS